MFAGYLARIFLEGECHQGPPGIIRACSETILVKLPDLVGILKNLLDLFLIKPFVKDLSESVVRIQKYLSGEKLYS